MMLKMRAFEFVSIIENEVQLEQGKGWGAGSIKQEIECVSKLQKEFNIIIDKFLDVGAFLGEYSLELLGKTTVQRVVLVEPLKANFAQLRDKFNEYQGVTMINGAVGHPGVQSIFSNSKSSFLASFYKRSDFAYEESVHVCSGEWLIDNYGVFDFIKIDVEGAELEVLKSFGEKLQKVRLIQFEFGPPNLESKVFFRQLWEFFHSQSWSLYLISRNGPIPVLNYSTQLECFKTTNFLALNRNISCSSS
jgi:FkbM family methyltransferase